MAEEHQKGDNVTVESSGRGLFDFMKKNKETDHEKKDQEEVIATEFQHKVEVSKEDKHDENKEGGLLHKLHRSDSSSSSSDEEEGDDEDKKKRKKEKKEKKGLKEKIKEKLPGHHKEQEEEQEDKKKDHHHHHDDEEDTNIAIEKIHVEEVIYSEPSYPAPAPPPPHSEAEGEKKGLLEKIKDKLPGQHKKAEAEHEVVPTATATVAEGEAQEKKGFLGKIKDKIPGFHSKAPEEDKKDVECDQPPSST